MSYVYIQTQKQNNYALIRFNHKESKNALSTLALEEIVNAVENFDSDDEVRSIIITGENDCFSSGIDLKELDANIDDLPQLLDRQKNAFISLANVRKPLIAAAAGYAFGQGIELLLNCDIVLAADNLCLAIPDASLGIVPGIGLEKKLIEVLGRAKTMEMMLCGRAMMAEEAEKVGLVSRIVPLSELENEAIKTAGIIAQSPEFTAIAIKETLKAFENPSYSAGIDEALMRAKIISGSDDFRLYLKHFSQK